MQNRPIIYGIVAIGPNNVIGRDNIIPWHSRRDFFHFKRTTMGAPCIFGKNTYDGLSKKPLPGRLNIVCSRSYKTEEIEGVLHVPSLEEAIKQCGNVERVFVCGGAFLYNYALKNDLIDIMYLTRIDDAQLKSEIDKNPKAYTYFDYDFNTPNWQRQTILYPSNILPPRDLNLHFLKYTRTR